MKNHYRNDQKNKIIYSAIFNKIKPRILRDYINNEFRIPGRINKHEVQGILGLARKKNVELVTPYCINYPVLLRQISAFPLILFCKGNIRLSNQPCISIVGSRKLSDYGKYCARKIVPGLIEKGFAIVSGMAFGTDAYIHNLVMDLEGKTIAVLASGVDIPTPISNSKIYYRILENNGLIISENNFGVIPLPSSFPIRNRIISGLSYCTIILEAGEKSGSLITAYQSFWQGRQLFAIPGDIYNKNTKGGNLLIKQGMAKLVEDADDVLNEIGNTENKRFTKNMDRKINFSGENETLIFDMLSKYGSMSIDEICSKSNLPVEDVLSGLTCMEVNSILTSIGSKYILI